MKQVQIISKDGSDFGANWWYQESNTWLQCDAYYSFYDEGEDSPLVDDGYAVEADIIQNLSTSSSGNVNGYTWQVIDVDGVHAVQE
jgi:hypothetical protein